MLELRPTCEHCNKALPPEAVEARICSFECTFCATCVDGVLGNVYPDCGVDLLRAQSGRRAIGRGTTSSASTLRA